MYGIKGILKNLDLKSFIKMERFWFSVGLAVIVVAFASFYKVDILKVLQIVTDSGLSSFPSIIGFCITGYALFLGFGNADVLEEVMLARRNRLEKELDTFYIFLSSRFAIYILFFIATFVLSYIINFVVKSEFEAVYLSSMSIMTINCFVLFIILFSILFSFMLMIDMIYIIYNYSYVYIKQLFKKNNAKKNKELLMDLINKSTSNDKVFLVKLLQSDNYQETIFLNDIISKMDDSSVQELINYLCKKK